MYAIISAVINGAAAKCVLLSRYRRIEETLIVKKTLFGVRTKTHREEKRKCIVFIPYRQALKEIDEIDERQGRHLHLCDGRNVSRRIRNSRFLRLPPPA